MSAAASSSSAAAPVDPARLPSALAARGISHSDKARWKTIYPIYINSAKKVSEGRKLPVKDCIEKPSVYDIADMCVFLKLPYIIEVRTKSTTRARTEGMRCPSRGCCLVADSLLCCVFPLCLCCFSGQMLQPRFLGARSSARAAQG